MLAVSWWMFVMLIIIAYTSNLTALVTSRPHHTPALSFRSYEDILRDHTIDIGMVGLAAVVVVGGGGGGW